MKVKLKELLIPQPKSKVKAGEGLIDGKYKFYTSSPIQSKYLDDAQYRGPALIFGTGGNASVHYCTDMFSTSTDCLVMYGSEELELIYYYLSGNMQILQDGFKGAGLKHISKNYILNIEIDLPCKETQREIVNIMKKIDVLISERKQQKDQMEKLVMSRFVEMFGDPENNYKAWPVKSLDKLCAVGSSKRIYQSEQSTEGVPFWRISDLVSKMDTGTVDNSLFISEIKYTELKRAGLVPATGDILVTSRGTLGRCYIIKDEDCFYFQDGMISWLSNYSEEITPLYLQYLFTMSGFRKQIDNMQAGSTVAYLSIAMLKRLQVMVPDKELQNQFAAFVKQTDKSKLAVQKSLDKLELLKKALMQKYFG